MVEHLTEWLGFPVRPFDPKEGMPDYENTIYRIAVEWDDENTQVDLLAQFLSNPDCVKTPGLIFGLFGESDTDSSAIVEALIAARKRLPDLKALFIGDIISEENEISWIQQSDLSPLFTAFPQLEHLKVRGGSNLELGRIQHNRLKSLAVQTGGLPGTVLNDILASTLPALEHLEIWTGAENYGWDGSPDDFEPLFTKRLFPSLKYLGLRNSEIANELAGMFSKSTVFEGLEVLDLSFGTLTDEGAVALLNSPQVRKLSKLDLHFHYLSPGMVQRIKAALPGAEVSDPQTADEWDGEEHRFVAVSE